MLIVHEFLKTLYRFHQFILSTRGESPGPYVEPLLLYNESLRHRGGVSLYDYMLASATPE